jgi:hypothetical protein
MISSVSGVAVSPFMFPRSWDSIQIGGAGGLSWQGRVDFVGLKRSFDWQFKRPPALKGDINTFRGTHCHSFTMKVRVWTDVQWLQLPQLLSYFQYDGTKFGPDGQPFANPVDIYHPALAFLDISQVLCEEIFAPEIDKEHAGDAWCNFRLHEFLPAVNVNGTKTPVATSGSTPFVTNAYEGVRDKIQTKQQEIDNLASQLGVHGVLP